MKTKVIGRKILLYSFVLLGLLFPFEASPFWTPYQRNDIGARAMAMGGAFVGVADDLTAVYWNPAGLVQIDRWKLSASGEITKGEVMYPSWLDGIEAPSEPLYETSHYFPSLISVALPTEKATWCISEYIPYDSYEIVREEDLILWIHYIRFYTTTVTRAFKMNPYLSFGVNLSYFFKSEIIDFENGKDHRYTKSGHGFGTDIGILYKPYKNIGIGFIAKHTLIPIGDEYQTWETLPFSLSLGISAKPKPKLLLSNQIDFTRWSGIRFKGGETRNLGNIQDVFQHRIGLEYLIKDEIALRVGVYSEPSFFKYLRRDQVFLTGGIGMSYKCIEFNAALKSSELIIPEEESETSMILSLMYPSY